MARLMSLKPRIPQMRIGIETITTRTQRITGSKLQAIRARWLSLHPLCVDCEKLGRVTAARELDHIVPLHLGGQDNDSNRQGLCVECHKVKTRQEAQGRIG